VHDLDRTWFETAEQEGEQEGEYEGEQALEAAFGGELGELGELELGELQETTELELANELLEVASEQELEQFLGDLLKSAAGATRSFLSSPTGRQLTGVLRNTARQALPILGRAAGQRVRSGGGAAGAQIAQGLGSLFGLELEGLSGEDREFEAARAFVRFAADAGQRAVAAPNAPANTAVRRAVTAAAQRHAPGLLVSGSARRLRRRGGRWARRGDTIVIYGI
jgi:hypothetical protein